ncbi:hypothetical protein DFH11DRAFT_1540435 [Phellopilus nigrolimitatus]|nr:hypothetical protein DFH11DRAFT_1540435 [Phellopilus nigrolimitatus]
MTKYNITLSRAKLIDASPHDFEQVPIKKVSRNDDLKNIIKRINLPDIPQDFVEQGYKLYEKPFEVAEVTKNLTKKVSGNIENDLVAYTGKEDEIAGIIQAIIVACSDAKD